MHSLMFHHTSTSVLRTGGRTMYAWLEARKALESHSPLYRHRHVRLGKMIQLMMVGNSACKHTRSASCSSHSFFCWHAFCAPSTIYTRYKSRSWTQDACVQKCPDPNCVYSMYMIQVLEIPNRKKAMVRHHTKTLIASLLQCSLQCTVFL